MVMIPPFARASLAFRHRFRIGQFQLAGVHLDRPDTGSELHVHLDVSAERSVEHGPHAHQVRHDVDRLRVQWMAARKGQQVAREPGAAGDRSAHGLEHPGRRRPR